MSATGTLLSLRVLSAGLRGGALATHLVELYRVLAQRPESRSLGGPLPEGVMVTELPQDLDRHLSGLGRCRFTLPEGVDPSAPPALVMQQLTDRLRARMSVADRNAPLPADVSGEGVAANGQVVVRLKVGELLDTVTLSSWTHELPLPDLNDVIA